MVTAVLAVLHLTTRTPDTEGVILINGEPVQISDLDFNRVCGTVVNGKGEKKQIDAQGAVLSEVCGGEFNSATVTASDEYSTVVEKQDSENAYLIEDNGSLRLVVFGDENARRDVKNVARIDCK